MGRNYNTSGESFTVYNTIGGVDNNKLFEMSYEIVICHQLQIKEVK